VSHGALGRDINGWPYHCERFRYTASEEEDKRVRRKEQWKARQRLSLNRRIRDIVHGIIGSPAQ
jgi:hypothetical protein